MGHNQKTQQLLLLPKTQWKSREQHGGILRQKRRGRLSRPLSTKSPIHLVFKADKQALRRGLRSPLGFAIATKIIKIYAKRFFIKLEQAAICNDHIHLVIRINRRSHHHHFLRVVVGQIAQEYQKLGLIKSVTDTPRRSPGPGAGVGKVWRYRPFTRVVKGGWRAVQTVRNYVRLNEKEARGEIPYRKKRLRGLSSAEWELLWI